MSSPGGFLNQSDEKNFVSHSPEEEVPGDELERELMYGNLQR